MTLRRSTRAVDEKTRTGSTIDGDTGMVVEKTSPNDESVTDEMAPADFTLPKFHIEFDMAQIILLTIAVITRFYNLSFPRAVVFDELHYTKYVGQYINQTFFFDGHPPLAKLLYAAVGYISGYNSTNILPKIGNEYPEYQPILQLRSLPAIFNCLTIPLIYQIVAELKFSRWCALLAAISFLCENSFLTQSRVMMAESLLIFMLMATVLAVLKLRNNLDFSPLWWFWLNMLAISIGISLSVKYISLMTVFGIFSLLAWDFWKKLADKDRDLTYLILAAITIIVFISAWTITIYTGVFYLHFSILIKAGQHDNVMTSRFQASLEGGLSSITQGQPPTIGYGSQITLRHTYGHSCWLHSHNALYPVKYKDSRGSSHQQQVTCYSFKDVNNWWLIKHPQKKEIRVDDPIQPVKHGDVIELVHGMSKRKLNSHNVAAPLSPSMQEVSGYINYKINMTEKSLWRVEIVNKDTDGDIWTTIRSHVVLVHVNSSQRMRTSGKKLPDWGYNQFEVVTDKGHNDASVWNVEEHKYIYSKPKDDKETGPNDHELLQSELIPTQTTYLTFWEKFSEVQWKMLTKVDKLMDHRFSSKPLDWPLASGNVAYWLKAGTNTQIHLLGNVFSWLSALFAICIQAGIIIFMLLTRARNVCPFSDSDWDKIRLICAISTGGYLLHYLPFHIIENTYFLHHYLPAVAYKLLILPLTFEIGFTLTKSKRLFKLQYGLVALIFLWASFIIYTFYTLLPLSYGYTEMTKENLNALKWRSTWDFIAK